MSWQFLRICSVSSLAWVNLDVVSRSFSLVSCTKNNKSKNSFNKCTSFQSKACCEQSNTTWCDKGFCPVGLIGQMHFFMMIGLLGDGSKCYFPKIAKMMIRIITVPFSLQFISLLHQILLVDRAAADEMNEVSFRSWKYLVNTTCGEKTKAIFRKPTNLKYRLDSNVNINGYRKDPKIRII